MIISFHKWIWPSRIGSFPLILKKFAIGCCDRVNDSEAEGEFKSSELIKNPIDCSIN